MPTDTKLINQFLQDQLTFDYNPQFISDKNALKTQIYALLTPKWLRYQKAVPADIQGYIRDHISKQVDDNKPLKIINACGGFKNPRIDTAPHVDWSEVFHLSFFTKTLQRITEMYEPGINLEYSCDGHVVSLLDNIKLENFDIYIDELNQLLGYFDKLTSENFSITHKHFLDFYKFEDLARDLEQKVAEIDINSEASKEKIAKYYARAKSNFTIKGEKDLSHVSSEELEEMIRVSVIKTYAWYDIDFGVRGDYFASGIGVANLQEFEGAYCIQSVRHMPTPVFWQGKGVVLDKEGELRAAILHVDDYINQKDSLELHQVDQPPVNIETLNTVQSLSK